MAIKGGNFLPHYSTKSTRTRTRLVDVKMNKDDQNRAGASKKWKLMMFSLLGWPNFQTQFTSFLIGLHFTYARFFTCYEKPEFENSKEFQGLRKKNQQRSLN